VVYPNQGVCRVTAVEAKEVAGQRLTFVTLRREEDGAVVMVPQAKVVSIGLRKVSGSEDVSKIFSFLRSDSDKANLDWKQRARTNVDRMAQGGLLGLAEVVKGLQVLSELRPLPTKERELYDNARHLLVAELAASLSVDESDAEDAVDLILFPVGKERPKRTAEEFRLPGADDLDLDDPLLDVAADLDLPSDEEPSEVPEEEAEADEEEEVPRAAGKGAKRSAASDEEVTEPHGVAAPAKRSRTAKAEPKKPGRPPKAKVDAPPAAPKKRGRPPKAKTAPAAVPKAAGKAKKK